MSYQTFKKFIPFLILGMMLSFFSAGLSAQNLQIHYINVQQGQSTLIIGPNGTTILYDGGYEFKGTTEVVPYLQSLGITTSQTLDYIITSHRHTDHFMGLTEVMNYGYDALNVYDNGSNYSNIYVTDFLNAAAGTTAGGVTAMSLGQVIDLGYGAKATCVAVNGSVIGVGAIPGGTDNENDRSICLLIEYGDFDFILTGDVGGGSDDYVCTGRSTSQVNIETPMSQAIMPGGVYPLLNAYGVEVAHVSHHGSESSTNSDYMNLMSPTIACIAVGDGQSTDWYHPRIDVVENVLLAGVACISAPPALVLQTEEGSPTGTLTSYAGYCVGDIIITTDGISTYSVDATGAVSQGPNETSASGLPTTYYFDEYSGGDPAPIVFNVHTENVTETTADVVWTTNETTDSLVRYGTSSGTYTWTASDASMVTAHSIGLSGLTSATTYYYVVECTDSGSNTTTSAEYTFVTSGGSSGDSGVVFSEIYYDTIGTDSLEEWIELYNNTGSSVDVSGWTIIDNNDTGASFTIPSGSVIQPGTYFTIAINSAGFNALYGMDADIYGAIPALNNTGDALILKDGTGTVIDAVAWDGGATAGVPTGWGSTTEPVAATGSTIVRTDPATDTDTYLDWSTAGNNGNPQTQATSTPAVPAIVFSEIYYDTVGTDSIEEWIELYNNTGSAVDIGGWSITDNNGTNVTFVIPVGTTIQPGTYLTIAANSGGFYALYGFDADIYGAIPALNNDGDTLLLKNGSDELVDAVAWEGGASAGIPDGWGSTSAPSASTGNSIARNDVTVDTDTYIDWSAVGNNGDPNTQATSNPSAAVVFSEIYYDTIGTDSIEEWIELYNTTSQSVDIGGWVITDNNGTGSSFTIPVGTIIGAGNYMTIAVNSSGFYALYGYNADIYGAIPALNNDGDTLILTDSSQTVIDTVAWEGGASAGIPDGWGSTSAPSASTGSTIIRTDPTVDTNTYADWTTASGNGNPQVQTLQTSDMINTISMTTGEKNGRTYAIATIEVTENGSPVDGASVAITWTGDVTGTDSGTTDSNGEVTFLSKRVFGTGNVYTITVTDVSKSGLNWDSTGSQTTDTITN